MRIFFLPIALFLAGASATLRLPSIFSDGCILQTNHEYGARSYVYGTGEPGEEVTVTLGATNYSATADAASGYFIVTLDPLGVTGDLFDIHVSGSRSQNVVVARGCQAGDVYVCGGQSNMCFSAESAFPPGPALAAQSYPNIKLFAVVMEGNATPQADFPPQTAATQCTWNHDKANATYPCNAWLPSTPETNGKFSAVCLFTALALAANHSGARPLGLVYSAFGGTSISLWAPPAAYAGCPGASNASAAAAVASAGAGAGALWNAMINPLVHYSLRSVLWFQGEQDAGAEQQTPGWYSCRFNRLIAHWRAAWGIGDFPFNFVQLGAVGAGSAGVGQGLLRVAQNAALPRPGGATDVTGMAATYDLGDASSPFGDVHFRDKVAVGARLAAAVLHSAFAQQFPAVNWAPPRVAGVAPSSAPPFAALTVALATDDGLGVALKDGGQCTRCCAGGGAAALVQLLSSKGVWVGAQAVAVAPGGGGLAVTAPAADAYAALRFAVDDYPQCAVVGAGNGFPLPAFEAPLAAAPALAQLTWKGRTHAWSEADALPPMGLNTWNAYHTNVDESLVRGVGAAFVSLGLSAVGWSYVNIDDGWQVARNASNYIVEDPVRFPSGMRALADAIHGMGLRFGLYTSATSLTCQLRPGSYEVEAEDAASYCDWTLDYIKVDNCGGTRYPTANASWVKFRKGIDGCVAAGGRRMALSVEYCRGGDACADWVAGLVDLWRCSGDIQANWLSLLSNLDAANANAVAQRPGHYNDPDMLLIGQPGISLLEAQSQLGAWAVVAAPLLLSLDLTQPQPPELLALLLNSEALAVSQDAGRVQGVRVSAANASGTECWARPLAAGAAAGATPPLAVLLLNRGGAPSGASCSWAELGIPAGATAAVRDLWAGRDLPPAAGAVSVASLPPHGSALLRVVAQA